MNTNTLTDTHTHAYVHMYVCASGKRIVCTYSTYVECTTAADLSSDEDKCVPRYFTIFQKYLQVVQTALSVRVVELVLQ